MPMRQWVLSLPIRVRWVLARRPALMGRVLAIFLRALSRWQRRRGRDVGVRGTAGAVTFVQRFSSALRLNIHFHVVAPDGVFVRTDDGAVSFRRLPPPEDADVEQLLRLCAVRMLRLLRKEVGDSEPERDALAVLDAASLSSPVPASGEAPRPKRLTSFLEGFSLHAGVRLHENDRSGLEQLCRYGACAARPPLASERSSRPRRLRGAIALSRLSNLGDGRVAYRMKRPLPDGRTQLVLTGVELLRKLVRRTAALGERAKLAASAAAPLVPPPRCHLLRFQGVFVRCTARAASDRRSRPTLPPPQRSCGRWWSPSPRQRRSRRPLPQGRGRRVLRRRRTGLIGPLRSSGCMGSTCCAASGAAAVSWCSPSSRS